MRTDVDRGSGILQELQAVRNVKLVPGGLEESEYFEGGGELPDAEELRKFPLADCVVVLSVVDSSCGAMTATRTEISVKQSVISTESPNRDEPSCFPPENLIPSSRARRPNGTSSPMSVVAGGNGTALSSRERRGRASEARLALEHKASESIDGIACLRMIAAAPVASPRMGSQRVSEWGGACTKDPPRSRVNF